MMKMKTMMMTSKPNYKKAELAAHQLLQLNNVQKLPVKVKKLSKKFPNLKIKTYSWFAKKHNMTINEVCDFANSDEGCCYYQRSSNQYLILYNDKVENKGRIRWTIAHELGHFMLKHNEISNKTTLGRSILSEKEYKVFEKEANCFARELLAPQTVIIKLGYITIYDVQQICDMSIQAASNVINFLRQGQQKGYGFTFNSKIAKLFSKFIYTTVNKHRCLNCNTSIIKESKINYCPLCGDSRIKKLLFIDGDDEVNYQGFPTNPDTGRPYCCPQCENEEVDFGTFCKICGMEVVNKCSNIDSWNGEVNWECGEPADGNARYCIKCGHPTIYFKNKLLKEWNTVQEDKKLKRLF